MPIAAAPQSVARDADRIGDLSRDRVDLDEPDRAERVVGVDARELVGRHSCCIVPEQAEDLAADAGEEGACRDRRQAEAGSPGRSAASRVPKVAATSIRRGRKRKPSSPPATNPAACAVRIAPHAFAPPSSSSATTGSAR